MPGKTLVDLNEAIKICLHIYSFSSSTYHKHLINGLCCIFAVNYTTWVDIFPTDILCTFDFNISTESLDWALIFST